MTASLSLKAVACLAVTASLVLSAVNVAHAEEPTQTYLIDAGSAAQAVDAIQEVAPQTQTDALDNVGLVVAELTPTEAAALEAQEGVTVTPDGIAQTADVQNSAGWSLDVLDQFTDATSATSHSARQYWYPANAGAGAVIFVVDSGVQPNATEFGERVVPGYDAIYGSGADGRTDCLGHGTRVASNAAGARFGTAKGATVVPVRVFACSSTTSFSLIVDGINWAIANKPADVPAVLNLSLTAFDPSSATDGNPLRVAAQAAVDAGFVVVIAAGNNAVYDYGTAKVPDACDFVPAVVPDAITVGALDQMTDGKTYRAVFSNAGSCVDGWAPGVRVDQLSQFGDTTTGAGTSFAAPLVSGLAAMWWAQNPTASAADVRAALVSSAVSGKLDTSTMYPLNANVRYTSGDGNNYYVTPSVSPTLAFQTPFTVPTSSSQLTQLTLSAVTASSIKATWPDTLAGARLTIFPNGSSTALSSQDVSGVSTFTFTGLTPGQAYRVEGQAISAAGLVSDASQSASLSLAPPTVAAAPGGLAFDAVTQTLSWTPPANDGGSSLKFYVLTYGVANSLAVPATALLMPNQTSTTLSGLNPSTSYRFAVSARNNVGDSYAAVGTFTTLSTKPGAPKSLTVSTADASSATLTWAAPDWAGRSAITDYAISYSRDAGKTWTVFPDPVSTAVSAKVTGLAASTPYQFRVTAKNSSGAGSASSISGSTRTTLPSAVSALAATPTASSIALTWSAPTWAGSTTVSDYVVSYSADNGLTWLVFADGVSTRTSATITGLTSSRTYLVRVSAHNAAGNSPASATTATTLTAAPSAPQSLAATLDGAGNIVLTWSAPSNTGRSAITDYVVTYTRTFLTSYATLNDGVRATTGATLTAPTPGVTYTIRVVAKNASGTGARATVTVITPIPGPTS